MIGVGGLGPLYRAQDLETHKAVALRLLAPDLCQDDTLAEELRERVKLASVLQHKNIAQVFGMGREGGHRFIAMELVEGRSLRHLVEKKRTSHKTFSLKGAYNVLAHVCNALTEAHKTMTHGLVGPGAVLINQVGRIKVCEFGVALALPPGSTAVSRLGDRYCIAPEVEQAPTAAGPPADIYSLGIVLFELLTGQPPPGPGALPSQVLPRLGSAVDQVIARSLHPDPSRRFGEARELKAAFYAAMQTSEHDDLDESGSIAAATGEVIAVGGPAAASAPAAAPQVAQPRPAPQPAQPVPVAPRPVARAPQPQAQPQQPAPAARPAPRPAPQQAVDIQALLADTSEDQTEKWLIQKDRLDFGPFSLGDLKQQLFKQEFTGDDVVVDQETGERGRIRNHPVLQDFIIHLERHFESKRADQAEASRRQQDRRRRAVLIGVVAGSLAILAAGGAITAYYLTREPETRERIVYRERDNLGKLLKGIDITWKKEPEEQAKKRRKLRRRRRRVAKAGGGGAADDDVTRLGDVTKEGGDALLSQKVVQGVMASNFGKLKGCVVQAARRDPSLRQVVIDFGVRGTGKVSSVKVNGKRAGPFQACVFARMRSIKFPSFDGHLTRAVFSMNLQY
jgi:serine/threonine protein kinase